MRHTGVALCLAAFASGCSGYVSSFLNSQLEKNELVPVYVNSLTSIDGVVPYNHYELDFCQPTGGPQDTGDATNLGTTLRGVRILTSPYVFRALENVECKEVCSKEFSNVTMTKFEKFTKGRYRANFLVDNLPAVMAGSDNKEVVDQKVDQKVCHTEPMGNQLVDIRGAPVGGCSLADGGSRRRFFLYNHLDFTVHYNWVDPEAKTKLYIVGFFVDPESRQEKCIPNQPGKLYTRIKEGKVLVPFTYGVKWVLKEKATWATRWDYYLNSGYLLDNKIAEHWERITRALLVILFLTGLVALILMRVLHLDFNRYNDSEEAQEEVGWKLVHTEVFRPPPYPNLFASFIGTGTQIIGMSVLSVFLALLGVLTPSKRGLLLMAMIFLFVLMAFANGYVTGLLQMMFGGRQWKTVFFSATAFPGFVFTLWAITEHFLSSLNASNSVDFKTVMSIILLWFGVCVPQAILGATFSYRQAPIENPLRYNKNKRAIPPQQWYFSPAALLLLPGLVPYVAAHYELELIMRSVWQGQVMHLFVFVALVFVAVSIAVCEVVLVTIYYQLVSEDYRWWWKSVLIPSGLGVYYLLYCVVYFNREIQLRSWLATWMYFSFCTTVGIAIILGAGTMGFFSSWMFVRKIYTSIKIE